jgi:hypothetical protein
MHVGPWTRFDRSLTLALVALTACLSLLIEGCGGPTEKEWVAKASATCRKFVNTTQQQSVVDVDAANAASDPAERAGAKAVAMGAHAHRMQVLLNDLESLARPEDNTAIEQWLAAVRKFVQHFANQAGAVQRGDLQRFKLMSEAMDRDPAAIAPLHAAAGFTGTQCALGTRDQIHTAPGAATPQPSSAIANGG